MGRKDEQLVSVRSSISSVHDGEGAGATAHRRRRPWVSLTLVLCLVIGAGVALAVTLPRTKAHPQVKHVAAQQPLYATAWDPTIRPLAAFVEKSRGLKFIHPVFVEMLTEAQFDKHMAADSSPASEAERLSAVHTQALLRALGEISDSDNLLEDMGRASSSDVIGFYSYDDKHVWIRGVALTPATRLTVVHELTHALDDQHFDLGAKMRAFEADNSGAAMAFDAIIEGDARRIEGRYRSSYTKNELIDLPAEERAQLASASEGDHSFPGFLSAQSIAAYPLGLTAVTRLARDGGNRAVDAVFRKPPAHELLITQPWLLGTSWKPRAVALPVLARGDAAIARGEFGALDLYLLLTETMPIPKALAAADAWAGDRYLTYTHDGTACASIVVSAQDHSGAQTLLSALSEWANGRPGTDTARIHRTTITLTACSPGAGFIVPTDNTQPALDLLVIRNQIEAAMEKDRLGRSLSICMAERLPSRFNTGVLASGKFSPKQITELQSMAMACRSRQA